MSELGVLRTFATFDADFPDDGVFDSAGNPTIPGGKNVADAIVDLLRRQGLDVTIPVQHSYYGWQFNVSVGKESFVLLLQYPGPWLLLSRRVESLMDKLRSKRSEDAHRKVLEEISRLLSQDARFRRQSWFTKDEYEEDSNRSRHEKP